MAMAGTQRAADPFSEHAQIIKALCSEYQKREDLDAIVHTDSLLAEMQAMCQQREAAVKDSIRGERGVGSLGPSPGVGEGCVCACGSG